MARVTNEVLFEMIKSVKEDTTEIKLNDIAKWKQINKNAQNISGMKGASGVIAGIVSLIMASLIAIFFKGLHQ
uniref:Uncharacterized protein n=1 Tax=viral metagenome TaxID=1070528 RepID=A0A6M3XXK1_9ZZZZ